MRISKAVVVFSLIVWSKAETINTIRKKRANQDNFNILINMYKLNPLKHSKVFKAFSNQVLLPRQDKHASLNLNTKESINENQYTFDFKKQYGEILHYSTPNKLVKRPLNGKNIRAESFNSDNLDNLLTFNQINVDRKSYDDADIFEDIFLSPEITKQRVKANFKDTADKTNAIDTDPKVYISKKKRKHNKKRHDANAEIILV